MKTQAIIFDMDNTLLNSKIDFDYMKEGVVHKLLVAGIVPPEGTVAEIMYYCESIHAEPTLLDDLWDFIAQVELVGGLNAQLEVGAWEICQQLAENFVLVILTNNSHHAAVLTMEKLQLAPFFQLIVGRGQVENLKPQGDGIKYIMEQLPQVHKWLHIGDAIIDAKASWVWNIPFAAYTGSRQENWAEQQTAPVFTFDKWDSAAMKKIVNFFAV